MEPGSGSRQRAQTAPWRRTPTPLFDVDPGDNLAAVHRLRLSDPARSTLMLAVAMLPLVLFAIVSIWVF